MGRTPAAWVGHQDEQPTPSPSPPPSDALGEESDLDGTSTDQGEAAEQVLSGGDSSPGEGESDEGSQPEEVEGDEHIPSQVVLGRGKRSCKPPPKFQDYV